jgi:putative hydrolase of the HAD superfamily
MPLEFALFDLDDTLYPRETGLLTEVGSRIQRWLCEHLELGWEDAHTLRRDYFSRYGTTLNGLIAEHDVDVQDYLDFVHDIPVETYLQPDPAVAAMLAALPLRRIVYTNATTEYSWRVLRVLGINDHFERVISIEDVGLRNKVCQEAYEQALELLEAAGEACIMVEDSLRNLHAAKALGLTTVLVNTDNAAPHEISVRDGVDFVVENILEVGPIVRTLLGNCSA